MMLIGTESESEHEAQSDERENDLPVFSELTELQADQSH